MLGVVEFAESCQDVFSHIATIYGVLMAHDDATFGFAVLRDLLGDLIERGTEVFQEDRSYWDKFDGCQNVQP
ncbi:hypothetical protein BCR33DRAFT_526104 [Rhizoclosmatium globosum]|uniref:Uncharacterized protein n=1 Tax=Rhizoclosmatium globosum TaxID=329046 RepID=A0A1Y2CTB1_9FUNG|nr:hypothetical protein BCR33DRAFT_526104 [Rhizoclosmatium globosum]|eukprot:ORY50300.1 hypothetical protein BCR33DRAFT_526104 [Rhizoclosmatium globosum]